MAFEGPKITWWNHQDEVPICKMLNHVMMNANWRDMVLEAFFLQTRWRMELGAQRTNLWLNKFIFTVTIFNVDSSIRWIWSLNLIMMVCVFTKKNLWIWWYNFSWIVASFMWYPTPSWSCSRWDNTHSFMSLQNREELPISIASDCYNQSIWKLHGTNLVREYCVKFFIRRMNRSDESIIEKFFMQFGQWKPEDCGLPIVHRGLHT